MYPFLPNGKTTTLGETLEIANPYVPLPSEREDHIWRFHAYDDGHNTTFESDTSKSNLAHRVPALEARVATLEAALDEKKQRMRGTQSSDFLFPKWHEFGKRNRRPNEGGQIKKTLSVTMCLDI